jgi:RNA polymerase sigma-70 factor (ECF subfamily)
VLTRADAPEGGDGVDGDAADTEELLERARRGDAAAPDELFARHRERLRQGIALRLDRRLAARVDVSDVLQETYLEAARRLPQYLARPDMPFPLWLRWLARERVLVLHRRHLGAGRRAAGREVRPLPADSSAQLVNGLVGPGPTPSQALAAVELAERLRLALQQLDEDERDLLLWRHFEQLSNREIAQMLRISEAAANKRYVRALQRLRGLLAGLGVSRTD